MDGEAYLLLPKRNVPRNELKMPQVLREPVQVPYPTWYINCLFSEDLMVRPERFELPAY
jgi:hypothetical protein